MNATSDRSPRAPVVAFTLLAVTACNPMSDLSDIPAQVRSVTPPVPAAILKEQARRDRHSLAVRARTETVMIRCLAGRHGGRFVGPDHLYEESREFLRHSKVPIAGMDLMGTMLVSRIPLNESLQIILSDPNRTRGWVVETDALGDLRWYRPAGPADLALPVAPSPDEPLTLIARPDGTTLSLDDIDQAARLYLSENEPTLDPSGRHRIYPIALEDGERLGSIGYLDDNLQRGMFVEFTREGTPISAQILEEPD
jgi:hypothetical protein